MPFKLLKNEKNDNFIELEEQYNKLKQITNKYHNMCIMSVCKYLRGQVQHPQPFEEPHS